MEKTITVKGTSTLSVKPNYIELTINLETKHMNYEEYQQIFDGYVVYHSLILDFDFDINTLNKSLFELTKSENNLKELWRSYFLVIAEQLLFYHLIFYVHIVDLKI